MQAIREVVAGVDVHKEKLAITVLRGRADKEPEVIQFECDTFTEDLMACGAKFLDLGVTEVAVESTGVYWKPLLNTWSPMGIKLTVGQAAHVKTVPGRKTDIKDSHWLAELHRFGLIRPSFIPQDEFQRMRLLSRHRTNLVEDLSRVKNRIQKTLEDGNVKFGVIASDVFGKSGLQVLRLIASGITDAGRLTAAVTTKLKRKEEARKALTNCLTKQHCFVVRELMGQYDDLKERIRKTEAELSELALPYHHLVEKLMEIPGISDVLAFGILAESTDDMSHFKDERSYAAWAGVAPGNNESGGKKKDRNVEREIPT
jgi:transposase